MVVRHPDGVVGFRFFRPLARRVQLLGEFNGWDPSATPMFRESDGHWVRHLHLKPGAYRFKYCADGEWFPDYAAFGVEWEPWGWNSVVLVDELVAPKNEDDLKTVIGQANHTEDEFENLFECQPYSIPALSGGHAAVCSR